MRIPPLLALLLLLAVPAAGQRHVFAAASSGYQFRPQLAIPVSATLGVGGRFWRGVVAGDLAFPQGRCSCWPDDDDFEYCRRNRRERQCDLDVDRALRSEALLLLGGRIGIGGGYRRGLRSGFYGTLEMETPPAGLADLGGSSMWAKASAGKDLVQFDFGVATRLAF